MTTATIKNVSGGSVLPAGPQGLSAYNLWIAAGNTGTVNQFLASLVGPPPTDATVNAAVAAAIASLFQALPTTLPATPGVLWNDGGSISLS